jgi:hypothetical protein
MWQRCVRISLGPWRPVRLLLAIGLLFFKAARLRKSPGGGQRNQSAAARGQDRGAGVKVSGKGKGKPKKVQWDKSKADAEPDNAE